MNCIRSIPFTVGFLLLFVGAAAADPDDEPKFTTQRVLVQTEVELSHGCKLCYTTPKSGSGLGYDYMAKGATKTFSFLEKHTGEVKIELLVFSATEKPLYIDIPTDSIPTEGDILLTLRSDFTVAVTSYKPKNKGMVQSRVTPAKH